MSYATFDDLLAAELDQTTLIRLTDDDNLGEVNQVVCEKMLARASERIDSKIGMRYELPLAAPVPLALKGWCLDLAIYYLFGRRVDAPGAIWEDRYSRVEADLDKVAQGRLTFGLGDSEGTGNRAVSFFLSRTNAFSRFTL